MKSENQSPGDLPQVLRKSSQEDTDTPAPNHTPAWATDHTTEPTHPPAHSSAAHDRRRRIVRRSFIGALGVLVIVGLLYPVENVVVAPGQVIPSDRVQTVQHLEGGIVTEVHVREGQIVSANDPLLEIDLGSNSLNLEQLTARHANAIAIKTRLTAETLGKPLLRSDFPSSLDSQVVQAEVGAFNARALEHRGSLAAAQASLHQARGDVAQNQARINGLQTTLRLHEEEASIARQLVAEQLIGQLEVIDKQRALEQVRTELAAARESLISNRARVELAQAKVMETQGSFQRRASEELAEIERELLSLAEDLSRARNQRTRTIVTAPTDGIIKGLRSSGAGWVVKAGEAILEIVPDKEEVIVEARLNPADRGYVHQGQAVKVKITAYDFLRYGSVPGTVTLVAADADRDPNIPDSPSYFRLHASLTQPWVGRTDNRITTGMQAEVDLLLGHEPFIWYILRPVLRVQSEAFREP